MLCGAVAIVAQVMFVLFAVATTLWVVLVVKAGTNAHRIHYLMIVLVTFKSLTLLSQAGTVVAQCPARLRAGVVGKRGPAMVRVVRCTRVLFRV
jgi:hypothetical protein